MKNIKFIALFAALLLTSSCTRYTYLRKTADLENELSKNNKVVLIPSEATINTVDVAGKKTKMYDFEEAVEEVIVDIVIPKLQAKGYSIQVLTKKDIREDKISKDIMILRENYEDILKELYTPELWAEEKAFNINSYINKKGDYKELMNSNLILFVDYASQNKTSGAMMKDFLINLVISSKEREIAEKSIIAIAMIDSKDGKVLWSNRVLGDVNLIKATFHSRSDSLTTEKKKISLLLDEALKDLPSKK